jgi:hypothetical protein
MSKVWGIVGWINSGKDTVADRLVNHYGFCRLSFAGSLKDAVSAIFGWDRQMLEGNTPASRRWRETRDEWWSRRLNIPDLTPRWVLQNIGTEALREHFHKDIWLASTELRIIEAQKQNKDVIISDCRFHNEFNMIKAHGGKLIRIDRKDRNPAWYPCALMQNQASVNQLSEMVSRGVTMQHLWPEVHPSEYNWVGLPVDFELKNTGTLDDLHNNIDNMMLLNFTGSKVTDQVGIPPAASADAQ